MIADKISEIQNTPLRRTALVVFTLVGIVWCSTVSTLYVIVELLRTMLNEWDLHYRDKVYEFVGSYRKWFVEVWQKTARQ